MQLASLTTPDLISTNLSFQSKEDVIKFLIRKLNEAGKLYSEENFYQAVIDRENLSPTGFEGGLAIPHGKSATVKEASFAIATLEKPLRTWESIDPNNEVTLVILLAIPENESGSTHLSLLSEMVKRLADEDYKNRLLNSKTNYELFNNLDYQKEENKKELVEKVNKTILAVTACPAGIAHTYMAAEALIKAGKEMGVDVFVEKQGAHGIEDRHTKKLLTEADAVIFATDVAVKNEERYHHLPKVKTSVATPIKNAKGILKQAIEKSENVSKKEYAEKASGTYEPDENEKKSFKIE